MAQVPDMPSRPPLFPIAIDDGFLGSIAIFFRVKPGVVLKAPVCRQEDLVIRLRESVASGFSNEKKILARLGDHPRITKYKELLCKTGCLLIEVQVPRVARRVSHGLAVCRGQSRQPSEFPR